MKTLGYPRLISLDNFRTPNFELVADCIHWLVHRFYPESTIPGDIATEAERVAFLQGVAQASAAAAGPGSARAMLRRTSLCLDACREKMHRALGAVLGRIMLTKARMKLNIKRLYAADGQAVRELLKLASLLCKATQSAEQEGEDAADAGDMSAALRAFDPRAAKALAADMARAGAALHAALAAEPALRVARARALAGAQDSEHVERCIAEAAAGVDEALGSARAQASSISELAAAEAALDAKLERRRAELERAEKRLATLAAVRPAYMDEYEALEGQLQVLYTHYLERHRNLQYLEARLEGYHRAEADAMDAQDRRLRKMQKRLADEELRILRGEQQVDEGRAGAAASTPSDSGSSSDGDGGGRRPDQRGAGEFGAARGMGLGAPVAAAPAVVGTLAGGGGWGDDDDEASIDEDTATDGRDVSLAGSGSDSGAAAGSLGPGGGLQGGGNGAGEFPYGGGDEGDGDDGGLLGGDSEDSGF
ncbi:Clusterin-associated protein 1 [Monoraphidium neglectum]|uniref:Clusterin-associated protein 1 n=1 Tax=Monoraphidium neglectum TaxID=145388 RepID=A0A0D2K0L0_9CHLO|nr:Clusterin-associated protein 1 [Monoraphidium neglectum]KIZ04153.1 Clusterin-associated protein 1 [Monoraphidium neglectum]|eukprot:XP_013903172.1 Clusterin-associated protein 1 [Monoraphidium neglectum]